MLSNSVWSGTLLIICQVQVAHGDDPFFFAFKFWLRRLAIKVLLVRPLWIVTEGNLEHGANDFYSHFVLALSQFMHLNALLYM